MNRARPGAAPISLANPVASLTSQFQQEHQQSKGPLWRRVIRRPASRSPPPLQKSKSDFEQWRIGLARRLRPEPKHHEAETEASLKHQPDRKGERKYPEPDRKTEINNKKPDTEKKIEMNGKSGLERKAEIIRKPEPDIRKIENDKKPEIEKKLEVNRKVERKMEVKKVKEIETRIREPEPKKTEPEINKKPDAMKNIEMNGKAGLERKAEISRKPELDIRKMEIDKKPEIEKKIDVNRKVEQKMEVKKIMEIETRIREPKPKPEVKQIFGIETRIREPDPMKTEPESKKTEPEPKPEPAWKRRIEAAKKLENEKLEMEKKAEERRQELIWKRKQEQKPETDKKPEVLKKPDPETTRSQMEKKTEMDLKPEITRRPEVDKKIETIVKKTEPERKMEAVKKPDLEKKPIETTKKPEIERKTEPLRRIEEKKIEPTRRPEVDRKPDPIVKKLDIERKQEPEKREPLFKRKPEVEMPEKKPEPKPEPLWKRKTEQIKADPLTKPVIEKKITIPPKLQEPKKELETIWLSTKQGLRKNEIKPTEIKKPPIWKRKEEPKTDTPRKVTRDDDSDSEKSLPDTSPKTEPKKPIPLWKRKQLEKKVVEPPPPESSDESDESDSECDLLCPICHELYDGETEHQRPVLLPRCGHTFCRECLLKIKGKGHFPCPTCCKRHFKPAVEDIPVVDDVLKRADAFRKEKLGHCEQHSEVLGYWCQDCRKALCGSCKVKEGHDVIQTKIVLKEKRDELTQQGKQILESVDQEKKKILESVKTCSAQLLKVCEASAVAEDSSQDVKEMLSEHKQAADMQFLMGSLKRMKSILSGLKRSASSMSTSSDMEYEHTGDTPKPRRRSLNTARNRSKSTDKKHKKTVQIEEAKTKQTKTVPQVKKPEPRQLSYSQQQGVSGMTGEQKAKVSSEGPLLGFEASALWPLTCCVYDEDGRRARVAWEDGRLHMFALGDQVQDAHFMIKLAVLQSVIPQDNPEVFIDLGVNDQYLGRFYVRLWGYLRRAHNFLALCMGTHGPSYRGAKFEEVYSRGLRGECVHAGPYPTPEGPLSAHGVMDNLEWDGKFKGPQRERLICGAGSGRPDRDACFDICTIENNARNFACPFGEVVDGWEVVLAARDHKPVRAVTMMDVGVIIPDFSAAAIAAANT